MTEGIGKVNLFIALLKASAEPSGGKKDQTAKFALRAPLHLPHFPATSALALGMKQCEVKLRSLREVVNPIRFKKLP